MDVGVGAQTTRFRLATCRLKFMFLLLNNKKLVVAFQIKVYINEMNMNDNDNEHEQDINMNNTTFDEESIKVDISSDNEITDIMCEECSVVVKDKDRLVKHRREQHEPHICSDCGHIFFGRKKLVTKKKWRYLRELLRYVTKNGG